MVGDLNPYDTYAAVGWALSQWESMELRIAMLFSVFQGEPFRVSAIEELGTRGNIFVVRLAETRRAAERYFVKHSDQEIEGDTYRALREAEGLSLGRHQIAHGIVNEIRSGRDREVAWHERRHGVQPPIYSVNRLTRGTPPYSYGSAEISEIGRKFGEVTGLLDDILRRFVRPA